MSIIHLDIGIVHDKGFRSLIRPGDSVQYTVIRRLSPEKAVIKFLGRNVVAAISTDYPDRGRAIIRSVGSRIELSIVAPGKKAAPAETVRVKPPEQGMLLAAGVKADARNIDYLTTVLRHLGTQMTDADRAFVISLIGKGLHLSIERLDRMFSRKIPLRIRDALRSADDNDVELDALFKRTSVLELGGKFPEALSDYVQANGQFILWAFMLGQHDKDGSAREHLGSLSANSDASLILPIFIAIDGTIHLVEMRYHRDRHGTKRDTVRFSVIDDERSRVDITFERDRSNYVITLGFHDSALYDRYGTYRDELSRALAECFRGTFTFSVRALAPDGSPAEDKG